MSSMYIGISNANHPSEHVLEFDPNEMKKILDINVVGQARMFKAYHKLLTADNQDKPSRVINISSKLGCISYVMNRSNYARPIPMTTTSYRISKAALNMLTRCQAAQVGENENMIIMAIHPGHVITDMGTSFGQRKATVPIKESCHGIVQIMERMNKKTHNGAFYDYNHNPLPW